jgi:hypothetical protein
MNICPQCGYSESNHVAKKQQSDKEFYLEFWGYTLDTPEAEEAWKQKEEMTRREAPMVDGSWIKSRSHHRAHLKEHRMIELGNDVPMQHQKIDMSAKSKEARKRQIAELAYEKLR